MDSKVARLRRAKQAIARIARNDDEHGGGALPAWVVSKPQLAELLGISTRTLDRLSAAGNGPPGRIRIGGSVRFDVRLARKWFDSLNRGAGNDAE